MTRDEIMNRFGVVPTGYLVQRPGIFSEHQVAFLVDQVIYFPEEGICVGDYLIADVAAPFVRGEMNVLQSRTDKQSFCLSKTTKKGFRYLGRVSYYWMLREVPVSA